MAVLAVVTFRYARPDHDGGESKLVLDVLCVGDLSFDAHGRPLSVHGPLSRVAARLQELDVHSMGAKKSVQDLRTREEREAAKRDFEVLMRQAAMEFDALDTQQDVDGEEGAGSDKQLDFLEFSRLVREREIGIHPEDHLHARFEFLDADGSGSIDVAEYMSYALQDAFERSAASLTDLFAAWDKDGNMQLDRDEFRDALRSYGFKADDEIIDLT